MSDSIYYLTSEKVEELKAELNQLLTVKRREVAENLEYAKKLGDLSENAEYHEAREKQAEVEDRINHINQILKNVKIVEEGSGDIASIGSIVKVQKRGDSNVQELKIVGSEEADIANGRISNMSPLGSVLLGKKKGDKVFVRTPKGDVEYTLVSIN